MSDSVTMAMMAWRRQRLPRAILDDIADLDPRFFAGDFDRFGCHAAIPTFVGQRIAWRQCKKAPRKGSRWCHVHPKGQKVWGGPMDWLRAGVEFGEDFDPMGHTRTLDIAPF